MLGLLVQCLAFLVVTGVALKMFAEVVLSRYAYVKLGRPDPPQSWSNQLRERLRSTASQVFGQRKLMQDAKSGVMHVLIFYGFIVVQFGALDLLIKGLGGRGLPIPGYETFGLIQEITVVLILLAIGYAAYRRYGERLPRLKRGYKPSIVVWFIVLLMLSVLLTLACERLIHHAPFSPLAPISSLLALPLGKLGLTGTAAVIGFYVCWWIHLLVLLAFLVYVPQSKHFHLFTAPINIWLKKAAPPGRLTKLDLEDEDAEHFGVGEVEHFTQKQLLDLYACVECGRCTNVCPASNTGKLLSPMHLMTKLRDHLTEKGAVVTGKSAWVPAFAFANQGGAHIMNEPKQLSNANAADGIAVTMRLQHQAWTKHRERSPDSVQLHGEVMTDEELWSCTTCRNCEEVCPVGNEHVDKIIDLRRYLVLTEGRLPPEAQRVMQNIERQSNPWGLSRSDRANWAEPLRAEGINVPIVKECSDFEYLLFVGSMGSYDQRSRKVMRSFVRLLHAAQVKFAILGAEELSSGDTARRMGNEWLFQELCTANIALFERYRVRKIVTPCPHTYNTFKHEYPEFGLSKDVQVYHHSELLAALVTEGRLKPMHPVARRVTYHDSCYLGRYNGMYDEPRQLLRSIPELTLVEMNRSRDNAMCCGAGGGMMWMEETEGKRVNVARTEQALDVKPEMISSACPYCLTMMEDGVKQLAADHEVEAKDIAELLALAVFGEE